MKIIKYPNRKDWSQILKRPSPGDDMINQVVLDVLNDVKKNGDEAVKKYTD